MVAKFKHFDIDRDTCIHAYEAFPCLPVRSPATNCTDVEFFYYPRRKQNHVPICQVSRVQISFIVNYFTKFWGLNYYFYSKIKPETPSRISRLYEVLH